MKLGISAEYAIEADYGYSLRCFDTCPMCGKWVDIMTHDSNICANVDDIIETTRLGDKHVQGIDSRGHHFEKIKGVWYRRPKTDYEEALELLDEEFPGYRGENAISR
jgi:hypothetical protein